MQNKYEILARHFSGQTNAEEEVAIQKYKAEYPKEYKTLQKLWYSKLSEVKDFDHHKAWKIIEQKAHPSPRTRVIPLYKKIVAVASMLIMLLAALYIFQPFNGSKMEMAVNNTESPMEVVLSDGSVVRLNSSATLKYPRSFEGNERLVEMTGEVFFDVKRDTERPFRVSAHSSVVEVLGTSFNIDSRDDHTEVSVATGKVRVSSTEHDQTAVLEAGEMAQITSNKLTKEIQDDLNFASWSTGVFHFENTDIHEVVASLNTFYKNKIILSAEESDCSLSTPFDNMELNYVVQIISVTCNLKIRETNETYELY